MNLQDPPCLSLEAVITLWPVASCLSSHLGAGDLISLARSSTGLRAVLHGFEKPLASERPQEEVLGVVTVSKRTIRHSLNIGYHDTLYWRRLKEEAGFVCSSTTHIRGDKCRPCRFCSKPICEACIIRSSFQRGKENTFNNRVRYFCQKCWEKGNISKSHRFPLSSTHWHSDWYGLGSSSGGEHCICTLKNDGWLCLECKDLQNSEAVTAYGDRKTTSDNKLCHGEGCENSLGLHYERRRICLWCQKTLPSPFGGASRHVWTTQMIEAKQRSIQALSADVEEYNRIRRRTMRMTRRELRGEDAVLGDPEADTPRYVRHLDTINYQHYMGHDAAPSGQEVYESKRGFWRYNRRFLLEMRRCCKCVPCAADLSFITAAAGEYARTNAQKLQESWVYSNFANLVERVSEDLSDEQKQKFGVKAATGLPSVVSSNLWRREDSASQARVNEWHTLKSHILDILLTQKLDLLQARVRLWHDFNFWAERAEFEIVLTIWGQNFDEIEQPVMPSASSEAERINISSPEFEALFVEEMRDHFDEEHLANFLAEVEKADVRMGDLGKGLDLETLDEDSVSNWCGDGIDQETIFKLIRSETATGKNVDPKMFSNQSSDSEDMDVDVGLQDNEPASSPLQKQKRASSPTAESQKPRSYLDDMDTMLMGGLAQYTPGRRKDENENVDMTFEPEMSTDITSGDPGGSSTTSTLTQSHESSEKAVEERLETNTTASRKNNDLE